MLEIVLLILVAWLFIGIAVSLVLSQTPYANNAWPVTTLLWPLFVSWPVNLGIAVLFAILLFLAFG